MKPSKPNLPATSTTPNSTNAGRIDSHKTGKESEFNEVAFNNADTLRLVALLHHEKLALEESGTGASAPPFDPYNSSGPKPMDNKPRKSIDDLRRLSAEIARTKQAAHKKNK